MGKQLNDGYLDLDSLRLQPENGGIITLKPYVPGTTLSSTDYLTDSIKGQPNGTVALDSNGKVVLDSNASILNKVESNLNVRNYVYVNSTTNLSLNDFDQFKEYVISFSAGVYYFNPWSGIMYTAPSFPCNVTMTVNGVSEIIKVVNARPETPYILTPYNGYTELGSGLGAHSSTYTSGGTPSSTHQSSDWQLSTDPTFTSTVSSVTNNTTYKVNWFATLAVNTTYYLRVRYRNALNVYSEWSSYVKFTTKSNFGNITETAKLVTSDKAAGDNVSWAVDTDSTGTRVVLGAKAKTGTVATQGAVYVFLRTGESWSQEQKLLATSPVAADAFGFTVAISADGTRLIVGANGRTTNTGRCFIYLRTGTVWALEQEIVNSDSATNSYFGQAVAMTSDGSRVIVGAYNNTSTFGSVYIFTRSGTVWSQEAKLISPTGVAADRFGWGVDISLDGTRCVAGGTYMRLNNVQVGGAIVYNRIGSAWYLETTLYASDAQSLAFFGTEVCFNNDATVLVVGSPGKTGLFTNQGAVYVFRRSSNGWYQESILTSLDRGTSDNFGIAVTVSGDGTKIAVGASTRTLPGLTSTGVVYTFGLSGNTWKQASRLISSTPTATSAFGYDCFYSRDGLRLIIGSPTGTSTVNCGLGYAFS